MSMNTDPAGATSRRSAAAAPEMIRAAQGAAMFGVGLSTWWHLAKSPAFPRPVKPSPRVTLWDLSAVRAYFASLRAE